MRNTKKTKVIFDSEAKQALKRGVDAVAKAVSVTMGPGGKLVILPGMYGQRVLTRDGVTVARSIQLEDPFENEAAQLIKQVATKTDEIAADGTTTSVVLAQAVIEEGMRYVATGGNAVLLKRGLERAAEDVVQYVDQVKQSVDFTSKEMLEHVATVSGNDPEVGALVAKAFIEVGENGVVTFEEGKTSETVLDIAEGLTFDRGMISPYFNIHPGKNKVEFENCHILVWEGRIADIGEFIPLLEKVVAKNIPLLVICDDLDNEPLATALLNNAQGKLKICAVKTPGYGERKRGFLEDIAIATGAKFFAEDLKAKLSMVTLDQLGVAKKVVIGRDSTTIVDPAGDRSAVEEHIAKLKEDLQTADKYDAEKLRERIAKLSSGVAVIKIGANTDAEMGEKKYRFEDAISAAKAALEDGIVPGAGNTLLGAAGQLKTYLNHYKKNKQISEAELAGYSILIRALEAPAKTILANAGFTEREYTLGKNTKISHGFDARAGKVCDLIQTGIIDPAKVTKTAVKNAISIAGLVLTTEALIVNIEENTNTNEQF